MKRQIFLCGAILFMSAYCACGQGILRKTYYAESEEIVKEEYHVKDTISFDLHGSYTSYFSKGNVQTKGNYLNNDAHGMWQYFYENGHVKAEGEYLRGVTDGIWTYFFENGKKRSEGILRDNKKSGEWTFYYENQNIKSRGEFLEDHREGVWNYFYEDGVIKAQAFFRDGVGSYKEFYASGPLKMEGLNRLGKSDSLWTYYYETGELLAEGYFKEGRKTGPWKYYYQNGNVSSEGGYENGETIGNWIFYYEDGSKSSEGIQTHGLKDGYWKLYYETGEIKGLGDFDKGTGSYKEYHSSGKLKVDGQFKDGLNEGRWTYYDEDGDIEGIADFKEGVGNYVGFYYNGTKKMEGTLSGGKKIGEWKLFKGDGSVAGTYHPLYEEENPVFLTSESLHDSKNSKQAYDKLDYRFKNRKIRYFTPRINEYKGGILSTNPFMTLIGRLPIALEYYKQERLGYELLYNLHRDPFFPLNGDNEIGTTRMSGYDLSLRQKFYSPDQRFGMFYFGHQVGFGNFTHTASVIDGSGPVTLTTDVTVDESRLHYAIILGDRIMKDPGNAGFTIDAYIGIGIGNRNYTRNYEGDLYDPLFEDINLSKTYVPFVFGLHIGYLGVRKLQNQ